MQLRLAAIAVINMIAGGAALAQAPGDTPVVPPVPADNTPPSPPDPTPDDYRDALGGERATTSHEVDATATSNTEPATGVGRLGVYYDSDRTTVLRALATIAKTWGHWSMTGGVTIDAVTSASVDVRSSPQLGAVDVITSASGQSSTSGGQMSDTRYLATTGVAWNDTHGRTLGINGAVATERDYASVSGGINGSIDVDDRNVTLLGGVSVTDNWISSVLDASLHRKMFGAGWSAGIARVLTKTDAVRLRYDGKLEDGDISSPYRNVRFGDWSTTVGVGGQIMFANTIGSTAGLAEKLPEQRIAHALALEWVHALGTGIGLHPAVRVGHDSWGINSLTPSLDLRIAKDGWRLQLGYRYYLQSRASFFATKYTEDPSMYSFYTSDKELGSQVGHLGSFDLAKVIRPAQNDGDTKMMMFLHADVFRYDYPGFELLKSRVSAFIEAGLGWEL